LESGKEFLLFCLVGVTTTVVDFAIFNLLTRPAIGWRRIPANIVSVTVAMAWSFLANWFIVFRPAGYDWMERAGKFLVTTAFSAFVLQNVVLYVTTYVWKTPADLVLLLFRKLPLRHQPNEEVISRNTCKGFAVVSGLIWNFCWYKFFVYAT
jgi:putative flippase GtrA